MTPRLFTELLKRLQQSQQRQDHRAGVLASLIANVNRDKKKRSQPFKPSDFFASLAEMDKPRPATQDELLAHLEGLSKQGMAVKIKRERIPKPVA